MVRPQDEIQGSNAEAPPQSNSSEEDPLREPRRFFNAHTGALIVGPTGVPPGERSPEVVATLVWSDSTTQSEEEPPPLIPALGPGPEQPIPNQGFLLRNPRPFLLHDPTDLLPSYRNIYRGEHNHPYFANQYLPPRLANVGDTIMFYGPYIENDPADIISYMHGAIELVQYYVNGYLPVENLLDLIRTLRRIRRLMGHILSDHYISRTNHNTQNLPEDDQVAAEYRIEPEV